MIWDVVSIKELFGFLASIFTFFNGIIQAFKFPQLEKSHQKVGYGLLIIFSLIVSIYATYITILFIHQENELNDRLRINKIRQQFYSDILPEYVEIVPQSAENAAVKDEHYKLLNKCEEATDRLRKIEIRRGGVSGNALEIYKQDNMSYLLVLTASLYSKLHQPGRFNDVYPRAEKAIKKVETQLAILRETFGRSRDDDIQRIIDWTQSDGIENRMYYTKAWITALKRLNNLDDVPIAEFDLAVRAIEPEFLRKYPLSDNYDIQNFLEEFNENLGPEFWDYYNELYPDSPFDRSAAQQDSN